MDTTDPAAVLRRGGSSRLRPVLSMLFIALVVPTAHESASAQELGAAGASDPTTLSLSYGRLHSMPSWEKVSGAVSEQQMNPDRFQGQGRGAEGRISLSFPVRRGLRAELSGIAGSYEPFAVDTGRKSWYESYWDGTVSRAVWARIHRKVSGLEVLVVRSARDANTALTLRAGAGLGLYSIGADYIPYAKAATPSLSGGRHTRRAGVAPLIRIELQAGRRTVYFLASVAVRLLGLRDLEPVKISYRNQSFQPETVTVRPTDVPMSSISWNIGIGFRLNR